MESATKFNAEYYHNAKCYKKKEAAEQDLKQGGLA